VRRAGAAAAALASILSAAPASAQGPAQPPGPYVVDLRLATSGVPDITTLVPLPAGSALPTRGRGFDAGVHVYAGRLGPARLGVGATLLNVRARDVSAEVDLRSLGPQLSFNFGTREGWSYLSAGGGVSEVIVKTVGAASVRRETGRVLTIDAGAGARWFLTGRVGVGFDLRFRRLSSADAMPSSMVFGASVGIAVR
jgi:hypothetical protein